VTAALDLVLRHNLWANRALLEFCAGLDRAALDRATPGTYGTLLATIQHVVSGEQWYVWILSGERIGTPIDENVPQPLEDLISIATRTGERAIELASSDDADRRVKVDGKDWSAGTIYAQLVHHGNEHRGQAKSILGANGIEPPGVSAWGFATDDRNTSWAGR
jgi:uncharacterized damage-inducible protein DinB